MRLTRSFLAIGLIVLFALALTSTSLFAQGAGMMSSSPTMNPAKTATTTVKASAADTTKSKKAEKKAEKLEKQADKAEQKADKAQMQADKAVLKAEAKTERAEKAADKAAGKATTPAAAMDDAGIASAVKAKLASLPSLKDAKIDVVVKGGVATLTGNVKAAGIKGVATRAAKSIAGVKQVDNQIVAEKGIGK